MTKPKRPSPDAQRLMLAAQAASAQLTLDAYQSGADGDPVVTAAAVQRAEGGKRVLAAMTAVWEGEA